MKGLTAVRTPRHRLDTDYSFAGDGEIVVPNASLVCDNPACGFDRAVMGLKSRDDHAGQRTARSRNGSS